jgi:hypothetical protein
MATKSTNTKKTSATKATKATKANAPVGNGFLAFNRSNVDYGFTVALIAINGTADLATRAASFVKSVLHTRIDTLPVLSRDMDVRAALNSEVEYVQTAAKGVVTEVKEVTSTVVELAKSAVKPTAARAKEIADNAKTRIAA